MMRGRAAALALVALSSVAAAAPARAELPLGREAFTERSRTVEVAPGSPIHPFFVHGRVLPARITRARGHSQVRLPLRWSSVTT
jgi:hypothetical protein